MTHTLLDGNCLLNIFDIATNVFCVEPGTVIVHTFRCEDSVLVWDAESRALHREAGVRLYAVEEAPRGGVADALPRIHKDLAP